MATRPLVTLSVAPRITLGRLARSSGTLRRELTALTCLASSEPHLTAEDLIQVGVIGGTHGLRGEVRVQPTSDFATERLQSPGTKWIQLQTKGLVNRGGKQLKQLESLGGRPHVYKGHSLWILRFKDINKPEEAADLKGALMMVHPEERQELPEDEYYIQQLIGLKVIHQEDGEEWGHIESVYPGEGSPDLLIVHRPTHPIDKPVLLPFVEAFVPEVDLANGIMRITPPEGLLELRSLKETPEERQSNSNR